MWSIITNAVGFFFDSLRALLPGIVGRVLMALGIGFTTYTVLLPSLLGYMRGFFDALDPAVLDVLGALRIDQAITLVFSAITARWGVRLMPVRFTAQQGGAP